MSETKKALQPRARLRRLAWTALAVGFSVLLFVGGLELALRAAPDMLPPALGNHVYKTYDAFPGGIYFHEQRAGMNFMRSGFATTAYYNGYRWNHRTDAWGFRNPDGLADKSVLVLGDSLVYGHGVEQDETAVHLLRTRHGWPAYNMARTGDGLYEQYVLFRTYVESFDPAAVVLVVFINDFRDLLERRSDEQRRAAPEIARNDYDAVLRSVQQQGADPSYPLRRQLYRSRALRLFRGLAEIARARSESDPDAPFPYVATVLDDAAFASAAEYYRLVLADMRRRCAERGTELFLALLDLGDEFGPGGTEALRRIDAMLAAAAAHSSIPYRSTAGLFEECDDCLLPGDGHLSPRGNRRFAAFLNELLRSGAVAQPPTDPV